MARPVRDVPWIEKRRDNGVYYVHWYDAENARTKRKSLDTRDAGEAQARFVVFISEGSEIYANSYRGMNCAAVIDHYVAEHVNKKVVDPERLLNAFKNIRAGFDDDQVANLLEDDFEDYAEKRRLGVIGRPSVDSTIRRELSALRAAVNHNIRKKRLSPKETPIWWLPEDSPPKCDKWITTNQLDKLLGAATTKKVETFIQIAYWTAGRKTVVELLSPDRIDVEKDVIDLHPPHWKRTKKRNPVVPLMPVLKDYLTPVLLLHHGEAPLIGQSVKRAFRSTVKVAGMEALGVTPHWLRHSRATHLLERGKSIRDVALLLGDTTDVIERVYGHHCPNDLKRRLA